MPSSLHHTFDLPYPSTRAVELMTDPTFLAELMAAAGSLRPIVDVTRSGDVTSVAIQREFEGQWPSLVAPLIGETLVITEVRTWHSPTDTGEISGTLEMHVKGQPVSMNGSIRVSPTATGCTARINGEVRARLPLIGGMVENIVLEQLKRGVALEAEVLAQQS